MLEVLGAVRVASADLRFVRLSKVLAMTEFADTADFLDYCVDDEPTDMTPFVGQARFDAMVAERDAWIRSWNRMEAAISHHKKAKSDMFVDEVDEALYAARDRILKERADAR